MAQFKPSQVMKAGNFTWSARTMDRVDQSTLAFSDVQFSRTQPTGGTMHVTCRRMIFRFQPKDWCQIETEDLRAETEGSLQVMSAPHMVLEPFQLTKVAPARDREIVVHLEPGDEKTIQGPSATPRKP